MFEESRAWSTLYFQRELIRRTSYLLRYVGGMIVYSFRVPIFLERKWTDS